MYVLHVLVHTSTVLHVSQRYYLLFQIDKLVSAGADILAPIPIGSKRLIGTAVDYSYHMYNLVGVVLSS